MKRVRQFLKKILNYPYPIFYCPYWRKCPHFTKEECAHAWVNRGCGTYRKYELEDGKAVAKLYEEILEERRKK